MRKDADGWSAGDIAFDFGSNNTYEYGLVTSEKQTSNADGIGKEGQLFDVSSWNYGIWEAPNNIAESTAEAEAYGHPTSVNSGSVAADKDSTDLDGVLGGVGHFSYEAIGTGYDGNSHPNSSYDFMGDEHYFVSTAISYSAFGASSMHDLLNDGLTLHWAANCNNDFIMLDIEAQVSEPPMLALLGMGLFAIGIQRRRKKR